MSETLQLRFPPRMNGNDLNEFDLSITLHCMDMEESLSVLLSQCLVGMQNQPSTSVNIGSLYNKFKIIHPVVLFLSFAHSPTCRLPATSNLLRREGAKASRLHHFFLRVFANVCCMYLTCRCRRFRALTTPDQNLR